MPNTKFVCGADVTFKGDVKYAMDPMGMFDSVEEAVICNHGLHRSFGCDIYEVDSKSTPNLVRFFGFRQGTKGAGYRIIAKACAAYNHPTWSKCEAADALKAKGV